MSAAAIVERLQRAGLRVRTDGTRVLLSPREKVTPDLLELARQNKAALLTELTATPKVAPIICADCAHFRPRPGGAQPDGGCNWYETLTWGRVQFTCDGYSPSEATHALEVRRAKVADMLRADPQLRYAYDIESASPVGRAAGPVSVMLGLRDATGRIITGELTVPADRWDMAAFIAYWDAQERPS